MRICIYIPRFHGNKVAAMHGVRRNEAYFWGVHTGAELDLLIRWQGKNLGFEFKLTRSPKVTSSMKTAREVLGLDRLYVVCYGAGEPWPLADGIDALPALCLASPGWLP